ncbi:NADPH-dependent FMN reductase [Heyndrickxia sporothermodurans]|uniref:FMN reductase n=1 Tax=Heyndrickxia sporothermodurans TaxID=46224 RepID=A0A150KN46_9BACI|nr:NADPH-dependent FMN reductase [Heyndrickxia sporothermodurans]KYD00184.1 FMN reductase [Heyndrickxia sporothermodurans]MBL5773039.1 NADPH-dependent FMN reductase [Heyndrickxia sporothermodurans]MBL5776516.1 NADPH-dependent FMN reductase [Heyndrickxia sporothermodurans]MBL5783618.1 NADPH-dependent FMN reductase [Heyndrickxia sporothermodurans]MBL5794235.1 NADPH-dependent FMN reductase [Heyndrickxia sporothermodurans]
MSKVVILCGSPSDKSRTDLVLKHVQFLLEKEGISVSYASVVDFSPLDLVNSRYDSPDINHLAQTIINADGVIIGSPVYKASYTGVLKTLIDLLPERILKGKPVFPVMVGGSGAHLLALDYALKPLITTLKGNPLQGIYILDCTIDKSNKRNPLTHIESIQRLSEQVDGFVKSIKQLKQFTAQSL